MCQSNQRPNTSLNLRNLIKLLKLSFDNDGIYHPCKYYEKVKSKINWDYREKELKRTCVKNIEIKTKNMMFLVPGSGGKDSIYVSHLLKTKYNMKPLTITWAPHMYTDVGLKNLFEWQKLRF